jgi:hypothetical protein
MTARYPPSRRAKDAEAAVAQVASPAGSGAYASATARLNWLPGEKRGARPAGTSIGSPVRGLRAWRAARSATETRRTR